MQSLKDAPATIRPYLSHSVELDWSGGTEANGDCPFCGKERHFNVNISNGMYRCLICAEGTEKGGGNVYTFLRKLLEISQEATSVVDYEELAHDRRLHVATLQRWGCAKSIITGEWLVPGYNTEARLANLYKYVEANGRMALYSTAECKNQLFGAQHFDHSKPDIWFGEGPWDGMAAEEAMMITRLRGDGSYGPTADASLSIYAHTNILCTPGCSTFNPAWTSLFVGKNVTLALDNDHEKKQCKGCRKGYSIKRDACPTCKATEVLRRIESPSWAGMRMATEKLSSAKEPPRSIKLLHWGDNGYDLGLPSGYDVRDALKGSKAGPVKTQPASLGDAVGRMANLLGKVAPPPAAWLKSAPASTKNSYHASNGSEEGSYEEPAKEGKLLPVACDNYRDALNAWSKALKMTDSMRYTLPIMLAVSLSTQQQGDQVWLRVIGPPGSAKTTMLKGIETSNYAFPISVFRGVHSGYNGGDPNKSASMVDEIDGKTVTLKDGDTLIQTPNRDQLLSELRDLYDGDSNARYRNKEELEVRNHRCTFIIVGTNTLRQLNRSSAGERFLDCVIYSRAEQGAETEMDILRRKAYAARAEVERASAADERIDPRKGLAMSTTGGYVNWLREDASSKLLAVDMADEHVELCIKLGQFVGYMRSRPTKEEEDTEHEVELATRLTAQFIRLAKCLGAVLNKDHVDQEVVSHLLKITTDTSRGIIWRMAHAMYNHEGPMPKNLMGRFLNLSEPTVNKYLRFMSQIEVARVDTTPSKGGITGRGRNSWRLTKKVRELCDIVLQKE